ncbi:glycine--tRNA ligase [bacterium]|nr:glycine--tRNA ligase [bacterium]|tara:strand:- start:339 stop:1631 length:1293 start_codon:yes stop_codon:yes gene_type:complete
MNNKMQKIVSLCKRRGFIFPGSEIYGGLANTWDWGPLGVELKKNIKQIWWKFFVQDRDDMVGLDGGIIMNPKIWEASGHVAGFKDPLVECKKCHKRFRPDKLEDSSKCPDCNGEFAEEKMFSGMFKTIIGPVEKDGITTYLRPETAQAIFVNFKNVLDTSKAKIPFGIAQIGKAFRNEITTGPFIFRTLEFEQMEIEYFIAPKANWKKVFEKWLDDLYKYAEIIGLDKNKLHNNEISDEERAHYSKKTVDIEYEFAFGQDELWGLAYRTNYDLSSHEKASGQSLEYFDAKAGEKYIPHVVEPSLGVDRTVLAVLCNAYNEEKNRTVLKLDNKLAPYKVAVFPLLANKPKLVKCAKKVYNTLKQDFNTAWDARGNIGKRYFAQDEIGTPYCITYDFESLDDNAVTVRDRDTLKQERIKIKELKNYLDEKIK